MWVCWVSGNRWWGPTQLSSIIHYPVTNQITRWNNSSSHYRQRPLSEVTARPTWYSIYIIQPEVFKLLTCASGEKCCKGRIKTLDQVRGGPNNNKTLFWEISPKSVYPPTQPPTPGFLGVLGERKAKFGSKRRFSGWFGSVLRDLVWESATTPTHIWEKSPPKKLFLCWGLP